MIWKVSFWLDGKKEEFSFEGNENTTCAEIIKAFVDLHKGARIKFIGFVESEKKGVNDGKKDGSEENRSKSKQD